MNREISWRMACWSCLVVGLIYWLALPGSVSAWDDDPEKGAKPSKSSKEAKSKAAFGDDEEDEKKEKDEEEFGGSRKEKSKASPKASPKTSSKSAADRKATTKEVTKDKEKLKLERLVERQLGRKEEGYFVFQVKEQKVVEAEAATEEQRAQAGANRSPFVPVEEVEFHVVEGRQAAVDFIVDYLSKYPPPEKKPSRSKRPAKGELPELPTPLRTWDFLRAFPDSQDGNVAAHELRDQAMNSYKQKRAGGYNK